MLRHEGPAHVRLTWNSVRGASGYLLEVEEQVDGAWKPIIRKPLSEPTTLLDLTPASRGSDYRWRVRSVVGRKGGRAASWAHLRVGP